MNETSTQSRRETKNRSEVRTILLTMIVGTNVVIVVFIDESTNLYEAARGMASFRNFYLRYLKLLYQWSLLVEQWSKSFGKEESSTGHHLLGRQSCSNSHSLHPIFKLLHIPFRPDHSPALLECVSALHAAIKYNSPKFEKQANQTNPFSGYRSSLPILHNGCFRLVGLSVYLLL